MRKFIAPLLLMALLPSCIQKRLENDAPAYVAPPILDSLVMASKPFRNQIRRDSLRDNIEKRYRDFEGRRFTEIEGLDFKIDEMIDCGNDTVFIALISRDHTEEYSYVIRVTADIDKKEASSLDEALNYHVAGVLNTPPEPPPFIGGVYALEINLGMYRLEDMRLTPAVE